ncbi:glucosaminidase domain-containing protein [Photobacterium japonica]|uniref:glucosaminidase domain-containing protein n=1 Tax=Photobacterium japonica TaxID=2910235 RepID=UPI003D0D11A2
MIRKTINNKAIAIVALLSGLTACGENPDSTTDNDTAASYAQKVRPDFSAFQDVKEKKAAFFNYLRPAVIHENQRVERERTFLIALQEKMNAAALIAGDDHEYAVKLGNVYKQPLMDDTVTMDWLSIMLNRVDVLPESLVLSQAANESGWGTSRFAVQGNNYFGQWCYRKGCGLIPNARNAGAAHEVAIFETPYLAVQGYFMNVNTHRAYQELRDIRTALRVENKPVDGTTLAKGLTQYSERGHAYVEEIQAMIRHNNQYWLQG